MTAPARTRIAPWLVALALTTAVASEAADEARAALDTRLDECASETGFPRSESGLPEDALAEGERAWRTCAYEAIDTLIVPKTKIPDAYARLIREDKVLTDLIEQGKVTRSQRRTRLDLLIAEIEKAERASAERELEGMRDELMVRQDELRRMRDIQSMMAR